MLLHYRDKRVEIKAGKIFDRENLEFAEDVSNIIWRRFGYSLNGGSYHNGKLFLGFDAGCSVNWEESVARLIRTEFGIKDVFIGGKLYTA